MSSRIPVNPGQVEWSGDNPGIYLKRIADGPFTALALFFRVVLSPHGRGTASWCWETPTRRPVGRTRAICASATTRPCAGT